MGDGPKGELVAEISRAGFLTRRMLCGKHAIVPPAVPRCLFLACLLAVTPALAATCPVPKTMAFVVEKTVHRDKPGFTEGLEIADGALLKSTGDVFGDSGINRIDLKTGHVRRCWMPGGSYFGEGLTLFGGRLYQMTYTEHRVFVFDAHLTTAARAANPREGWGLTHDATASDRQRRLATRLFFLSPEDFATLGALPVHGRRPAGAGDLNELEYVQGAIWANVFETWTVLRISPRTGCVEAKADLRRCAAT